QLPQRPDRGGRHIADRLGGDQRCDAVLGLAPLTGVPLPLVSYGSSSLIVTLAAMGLLLNVAAGGTGHVRAVAPPRRRSGDAPPLESARWSGERSATEDRDSRG